MRSDPPQKFDDHLDQEERWESAHRRHRFLAAISVVLLAAVVGLAWFGYDTLKRQGRSLADVPVLTQAVDALRTQLHEAGQKAAADSASARQSLRDETQKLTRDLKVRVEDLGKRASQSAEDTYNKLQARLDAEVKARTDGVGTLNERVSTLESSHTADQTQIAQLQQQVTELRGQNSHESSQLAQVHQEIEQTSAGSMEHAEQIAGLRRDEARDRSDVEGISARLAVKKVTFEASKDRDQDLGEGIRLHVSGTDTNYRRVKGWVWVAKDNRYVWLDGQGAQQPVIFYGYRDGLKRELVFTNVAQNSVTGYLLLPRDAAAMAKAGTEAN